MKLCIRLLLTTIGLASVVAAQSPAQRDTVRSVRQRLERLPYYGVFEYIAFGVDRGTITLVGYSYDGRLRNDAEMAVRRASGVDEIDDKIGRTLLLGVVDSASDRTLAEVRAREVSGVFEVDNGLTVPSTAR